MGLAADVRTPDETEPGGGGASVGEVSGGAAGIQGLHHVPAVVSKGPAVGQGGLPIGFMHAEAADAAGEAIVGMVDANLGARSRNWSAGSWSLRNQAIFRIPAVDPTYPSNLAPLKIP